MLEHSRHALANWPEESRENKLRTARELLVNSHHTRCREDLVLRNWLSSYLKELQRYNTYGDFEDPELAIAVARSCVNLAGSEESHLYFVHEQNRPLHMRLFKEPWLGLNKGEVVLPEPIEWVFHLANLRTSEEAPKLGLAILLNLSATPRLQETIFAKKGLTLLIDKLASLDAAMQRMAAAAIWNISKNEEIMDGITRFLSVSDTLERLASKGVPMKRPPSSVLIESIPSILREATVNLGELDCNLGGEPDFVLGVHLASTGVTMMTLRPFGRAAPQDGMRKAKFTTTRNPPVSREEAQRRLRERRRLRAESERRLLFQAVERMTFQEVRDDLTSFGLIVEDIFDREAMNAELVDLMLSDATREALGLEVRRADERAAEEDAFAQKATIKDSTEKGLVGRPRRKE
mmetsp:Transcript_23768/g.53645  ORF Transcript_23768/g.53645 Transcript_23768/m.53645 type:complete len:406 (-) Transcript_23768:222-1439(-)